MDKERPAPLATPQGGAASNQCPLTLKLMPYDKILDFSTWEGDVQSLGFIPNGDEWLCNSVLLTFKLC